MPATKKLSKKALDKQIEAHYYKHGQNVEINVMDTTALFNDCRKAYADAEDLEQAVITAIAKYRKN